ncbi:hypothetical protein O181_106503 [Austropuccinia psidii MF-1]|uniref:Uncharacterized protein n=1 Tax=Austropuccinia psidii MF-1 TaxID=1389203 RepID=A0A9Q3JQV1_9BASI|nr:hypothetical protein [Austropuccinia psidii MF-1]
MRSSKKDKLNPEGFKRHIYGPVQAVLHGIQEQRLQNITTNSPRSDELLEHSQKVPQIGGKSEILQWMESTIIQNSIQKYKGLAQKKEGGKQGRSPRSFSQKATSQPTSPRREEEQESKWRKPYSPSYRMPWTMSSTWPEP